MRPLADEAKRALAIAMEAHRGQKDKAGADYIQHPVTVALTAAVNGYDDKVVTAALLHDVVEDTGLTFADLKQRGISDEVIDALKLLTHDKSVPYLDYVRAVKDNPIARAVKMADLSHNMDLSRLPEVTPADLERLEKYRRALQLLTE